MGRNKIKIEKIKNEKLRQITLLKRKRGVLKKAMELSLLCEAKVLLIIYDDFEKKSIFYSSEEDYKSFANDYFEKKFSAENYLNSDYNSQFYKESDTTKSCKTESVKGKTHELVVKDNLFFNPEVLIDDKSEKGSLHDKLSQENVFKKEEEIKPPRLLSRKRSSASDKPQSLADQFVNTSANQPYTMPACFDKMQSPGFNNISSPNSNFTLRNSIYQNELNKLFFQNYMNMYLLSNKY